MYILSNAKQSLVKTVLKLEESFSSCLNSLNSVFNENFSLKCESFESLQKELYTFSDEEEISKLVERINFKSDKFKDVIIDFSQHLQDIYMQLQESKKATEEAKNNAVFYQQQLNLFEEEKIFLNKEVNSMQEYIKELKAAAQPCNSMEELQSIKSSDALKKPKDTENEFRTLSSENNQLKNDLKELETEIAGSKKFQESVTLGIVSSREQIVSLEKQIENNKILLNLKDEEISNLQTRISNLQVQINELLTEKIHLKSDESSKFIPTISGSISPDSSSNLAQQKDSNSNSLECANNSILSIDSQESNQSLSKSERKISHEKCLKKIRTLQTKLEMSDKRIENLEKDNEVLRENLLACVHDSKKSKSFEEDAVSKNEKLLELESKLERKQSFIKELKSDLYKANDSLIDKQKENDKLQRELLKYKNLAKESSKVLHQNIPLASRVSDSLLLSTETNISDLRKQKNELISSLLDLQKQFYKTKNIPLKHFEKFSKHIESLQSLQEGTLQKSGSAPLLNSALPLSMEYSRKWDKTLKNTLIDLEVDVECLQNFKIFLNSFFSPIMLQESETIRHSPVREMSFKKADIGIQAILPEDRNSSTKHMKIGNLSMLKSFESIELLRGEREKYSHDRLTTIALNISNKLDWVETILKSVMEEFHQIKETDYNVTETSRKLAAASILQKLFDSLHSLQENADEVFYLNSTLKSLKLFDSQLPRSISKQDVSDQESLLSEETITLSRSESLSPVSFEENFPLSSTLFKMKEKDSRQNEKSKQASLLRSHRLISNSQDSVFQRSHYSSPDLGIESDPNHENSAPEQIEKSYRSKFIASRNDLSNTAVQTNLEKQKSSLCYSLSDNSIKLKDDSLSLTVSSRLHAIGILQEYELLKREVSECLVGIRSVLSRTGDGMQHISTHTSPRKKLEYSTFKAIKDTCVNIETCLQKAVKLVNNFWIAPCPSEKELTILLQHNEELNAKLKKLYESKKKQESDFKDVLERLKQAEILKEKQEQKISKKLVKTKQVLRLAEKKILENKNKELPPSSMLFSKMPRK